MSGERVPLEMGSVAMRNRIFYCNINDGFNGGIEIFRAKLTKIKCLQCLGDK